MKTTLRFESAVTKLYKAFHAGEFNAMDSCGCAVGNLCNNDSAWNRGRHKDGYNNVPKKFQVMTGYNANELRIIESLFMCGAKSFYEIGLWNAKEVHSKVNNDLVFTALCAVVEYLCELDGIPNVMDFTLLFETENNKPKHELQTVF